MAFATKEKYNAYMKQYMNKKYQEKKAIKLLNNPKKEKKESKMEEEEKQEMNFEAEPLKQIGQLAKTAFTDKETGQTDKIGVYIEQGIKYMPMVIKFIQGFSDNYKSFAQQQQQQQAPKQNQNKPQAPEGWLTLSPLQKLNYKYSKPEWYSAGERYDQAVSMGGVNPNVNINYVDRTYTQEMASEPKNLQELSRRYPEPPLVDDSPLPNAMSTAKEVPPKEGTHKTFEEIQQEVKNEKGDENKMPTVEEIANTLQNDARKYFNIAIEWLQKRELESFKKDIENIDGIVNKFVPLSFLIPVHLKDMIVNTKSEDLVSVFKESCPDKFEWLEKENKVLKLTELFETLKSKL